MQQNHQQTFFRRHLSAFAWTLVCAGAIAPTNAVARTRGDVPRLESAEAQFKHAGDLRTQARKAKGAERTSADKAAALAFHAVREYFPDSKALAAEASFRAGELLRAAGDDNGAASEFRASREVGGKTSFKARAGIELGHLARRTHDLEAALKEFQSVADDEEAEKRYRDDAALWAARATGDLGHVADARKRWEALTTGAESPVDRIEAFDDLATSFVESGELDAASGIIDRCRTALADVAAEQTPLGERTRNALARMRSVRRLEHERETRQKGVNVEKKSHQ